MHDLPAHLATIEAELDDLRARPLSVRHALLVAALLDRAADLAFAGGVPLQDCPPAEDVLSFRASVASASPVLAAFAALCGMQPGAPVLRVADIPVPEQDTEALSTAEFMVSLYNRHTVPRVVLTGPAGGPVLPLLEQALQFWRARLRQGASTADDKSPQSAALHR